MQLFQWSKHNNGRKNEERPNAGTHTPPISANFTALLAFALREQGVDASDMDSIFSCIEASSTH